MIHPKSEHQMSKNRRAEKCPLSSEIHSCFRFTLFWACAQSQNYYIYADLRAAYVIAAALALIAMMQNTRTRTCTCMFACLYV